LVGFGKEGAIMKKVNALLGFAFAAVLSAGVGVATIQTA
jgi:hypothetical protein